MYKELAAGGVVYRFAEGRIHILMIVDRYGKWALPKGKLEAGETPREAALREINEETAVRGEIIRDLLTIKYQYSHPVKGTVDKEVHYYLVKALTEEVSPQPGEVTTVQWYELESAIALSDYGNNLEVLRLAQEYLTNPTHPCL